MFPAGCHRREHHVTGDVRHVMNIFFNALGIECFFKRFLGDEKSGRVLTKLGQMGFFRFCFSIAFR